MEMQQQTLKLPQLRRDLTLHKGPKDHDGAPSWTIYDPVRNRYFRIGWVEFELLSRWQDNDAALLMKRVNEETTAIVDEAHLKHLIEFLILNNLVVIEDMNGVSRLTKMARLQKKSYSQWLLHNYLFFRIPLVRPDVFLTKTLDKIEFVFHKQFLWFMFAVFIISMFLVMRQWESFQTTFLYFFSLEGFFFYFLALVGCKIFHELGHAYTAKYYGLRVPTMGVAFLVMWPVLYTDTTDAWKLVNKYQRILIGSAGVIAELMLAIFATLGWSVAPEGPIKSALFFIATVTWVMTVLININPFMRFDGYYILADFLDVQNLQDRSFRLGKWWLRKTLWGWHDEVPEILPPKLHKTLIIYAISVWIYRFFLFIGIAVLVYYFFFKALGIFLMVVEIIWFILKPIYNELKVWWQRKEAFEMNKETKRSLYVVAIILLVCFIPWRSSVNVPGILKFESYHKFFPVHPAQISEILVKNGMVVTAGQTLFVLSSPDLDTELKRAELQLTSLRWQSSRLAANQNVLERRLVLEQELASIISKIEGLKREKEQMVVKAPFDGIFYDLDEKLAPKQWVNEQHALGLMVKKESYVIEAFIPEKDLKRIDKGRLAYFKPENFNFSPIKGYVDFIDKTNTKNLDTPYLASLYKGEIAVKPDQKEAQLVPDLSIYRLLVKPEILKPLPPQIWRGTVIVYGKAESLMMRMAKKTISVLIRESGF